MQLKKIAWVFGVSVLFFFLPSLAGKIWSYLSQLPWGVKSVLIYFLLALGMVFWVRKRKHRAANPPQAPARPEVSLLQIVKERLAKGEIGIEEYRQLKKELNLPEETILKNFGK